MGKGKLCGVTLLLYLYRRQVLIDAHRHCVECAPDKTLFREGKNRQKQGNIILQNSSKIALCTREVDLWLNRFFGGTNVEDMRVPISREKRTMYQRKVDVDMLNAVEYEPTHYLRSKVRLPRLNRVQSTHLRV